MVSASTLRQRAWGNLKGNYWNALLVTFIFALIIGAVAFTYVGAFLLEGVLLAGLNLYFLNLVRKQNPDITNLFNGFYNFVKNMATGILVTVFIMLWTLLFIIPGIIKSYSYALTFYIVNDHPELSSTQAIDKSRQMMNGKKWNLFCLHFSFIGWFLLSILTLGIGLIFLTPYIEAANAEFYQELKNN